MEETVEQLLIVDCTTSETETCSPTDDSWLMIVRSFRSRPSAFGAPCVYLAIVQPENKQ